VPFFSGALALNCATVPQFFLISLETVRPGIDSRAYSPS
jgi:hypothetical protein